MTNTKKDCQAKKDFILGKGGNGRNFLLDIKGDLEY